MNALFRRIAETNFLYLGVEQLGEVADNSQMPAVEHLYRYKQPSSLEEGDSGLHLHLVATKDPKEKPIHFLGKLIEPTLTAQCLQSVAKVVQTRFYVPPAMLTRILLEADPVVTTTRKMLRFEGFSSCCSTYARLDIGEAAFESERMEPGTTNVDFQADMRSALARVRDGIPLLLSVHPHEVQLETATDSVIERKVTLPLRWVKGMAEVQAQQIRMTLHNEVPRVEALRFLRELPRGASRHESWVVPAGKGLRLAHKKSTIGFPIKGTERLRVLENLVPKAKTLRIYSGDKTNATAWVLDFGNQQFTLVLSAEPWRGFSGEGQLLEPLAKAGRAHCVAKVQGVLKWQDEINSIALGSELKQETEDIERALALLASRGLVGFDVGRGCYFHRVLPFDLSLVESLHPRLKDARKIVEGGKVTLSSNGEDFVAEVPGTDVTHRVHLTSTGDRCSCPWFAKHGISRGPCKHILAAQIASEVTLKR